MTPPATPSPPQDETSPDSRDGGPLPLWRIGTLGLASIALATFLLSSPNLLASPTAQSLQSQSSFSQQSFDPGQTAVFHITDSSLDTLFSCTATWADADPGGETWGFETYWNIVTGAPAPSAYQGRSTGCAFVSTSTTPLEEFPELDSSWVATVIGQDVDEPSYSVTDFFESGNALLDIPDLTSTSTIAFPFYFHAQNSYAPAAQRVRVTSVTDPVGEWAALSEVASTTDSGAAVRSGVFRGSVELRADADATEGDGIVRVDGAGDVLELTYYGLSGQTAVSTASAQVGGLPPSPTPTPTPTATPLPDIAFSKPSFVPGQRAVFYVTDWGLNRLSSCTARWADAVPDGVIWDAFTHWNIFTGEPALSAYYGWGSGCEYVSTADTPVEPIPIPWLGGPWLATVNGVDAIVGEFYVDGEFAGNAAIHANNFSSINTIKLPFYYHVHDTYSASSQRARVTSGADPAGEWAALTEVVSTTDSGAAVMSGVFRGSVELRADADATEGDGVVHVDAGGDTLRLRYYGPSGDRVVGASTALVLAPAPAPTDTPVPTAAYRRRPTPKPTPTITPTRTPIPVVRRLATLTPTPAPTHTPSPTALPTATPRATPTPTVTPTRTPSPTAMPTATPTPSPTPSPTATPLPTATATATVTSTPTLASTATPTPTAPVVEQSPPAPTERPAATVPPLTPEEADSGGACGRPAGGPPALTALANLALLAAPLGLTAILRRKRRP